MKPGGCLYQTFNKIRSLPELKYLHTLDGQNVLLEDFFHKCLGLWPMCYLFAKFYYWKNEIRTIISTTSKGSVKHTIKFYEHSFSSCYPEKLDRKKTHGDVAEFYDEKGNFMGLAVYMGNGKYCSLPYKGCDR
jgi:hypothetical protein